MSVFLCPGITGKKLNVDYISKNSGFRIEYMGLSSVHELKQRLDSGEDALVLDVRDENEWKEGHIKGALHVYVGQLESQLSKCML
ncbi:MAG: rhodanese-like domain-containing protein [Proteobacteria bacterium]|nr:rhodanese-like domain-containing protein [Pseudomonadota bacterium]